jgi:hypothetical protein
MKQIKIKKKSIYGKNVFNSTIELAYYRKYKMMKVHKSEVISLHQAIGRAEGFILSSLLLKEIDAWQHLIDTGYAWTLQGWFGRRANFLIEEGLCKRSVVH